MRPDREQPGEASTRSSMNQDRVRFWMAINSSGREGMVFNILLNSCVFMMLLLNSPVDQAWLWLEQALF